MDDLLELIFSNPLFLILIIGGLISLFRGRSSSKNEQDQQSQRSRQPQQTNQQTSQRPREVRQQKPQSQPRERVVRTTSVEEQRQKQLKKLTNQYGADPKTIDQDVLSSSDDHSGLTSRPKVADERRKAEMDSLHNVKRHRRLRKKFKSNLTRKGLVDSVVMSEVLGSPRARKPYQSVVNQRKHF